MVHLHKKESTPALVETRGQAGFIVEARFSKPLTQVSSIQQAGIGNNIYDQGRAKELCPYSFWFTSSAVYAR
jgi:hypothetical protein